MKKSIMKKITVVGSHLLIALTLVVMSYGALNKNVVHYIPQHNHVVTNTEGSEV